MRADTHFAHHAWDCSYPNSPSAGELWKHVTSVNFEKKLLFSCWYAMLLDLCSFPAMFFLDMSASRHIFLIWGHAKWQKDLICYIACQNIENTAAVMLSNVEPLDARICYVWPEHRVLLEIYSQGSCSEVAVLKSRPKTQQDTQMAETLAKVSLMWDEPPTANSRDVWLMCMPPRPREPQKRDSEDGSLHGDTDEARTVSIWRG